MRPVVVSWPPRNRVIASRQQFRLRETAALELRGHQRGEQIVALDLASVFDQRVNPGARLQDREVGIVPVGRID